jgi:N-ethylmaleimide reductase
MLEVTEAVIEVWGANRVGIRLSPRGTFNSMGDSDRAATFSHAVEQLSKFNLAYLHLIEPIAGLMAKSSVEGERLTPSLRRLFHGPIIVNGGYDKGSAEAVIERGEADLVAFGVPFIANPDLPLRFATGAELAKPDPALFYMGGERGYVDYPALEVSHQ